MSILVGISRRPKWSTCPRRAAETVCPQCDGHLVAKRGIEVGNTFMLGTKYSIPLNATFLDAEGKENPMIMGSYGIGITRTPQAALEKYHDDKGIIWPKNHCPVSGGAYSAKPGQPATKGRR